ncbi:hypothetical protein BURC_03679 [Burkholderiaceae bacterium]|nr:hypothetical protein BURC_03679 [Burkholderiaceae bacterium]
MGRRNNKNQPPKRPETLQRVDLQALPAATTGLAPPEAPARQPITFVERGGERLFLFGDADRHERRLQRHGVSPADRLFWVTIAVACGAPGRATGKRGQASGDLAKRYGLLERARNDLNAFYDYYRPMRLGSPSTVCAAPGADKSAGFFDCTVRLDNPSVDELHAAVLGLREWLDVNQHDPEFTSFQLNFAFSGHGDADAAGTASLVLSDAALAADDLASMLLSCIPEEEVSPSSCRFDLFLDCCKAGAIARALTRRLRALQADCDTMQRSRLDLGQLYCACLDDEEAFELEQLPHSLFTFAFLNECSRKRPEGAESLNLALRDVGWHTNARQHPMLLDFTDPQGVAFKFPSAYHLTHPPLPGMRAAPGYAPAMDAARHAVDPVGEYLGAAAALREQCVEVERELLKAPQLRVPFSRDEILGNRRFPFL